MKQLRPTTLNIKTLLPKEGLFSGIHLLPNGFRVVFQAEAHGGRWPCRRACVLICKKGHVFLAEFKGAEAGSHPGGIS